MCTVASAVAGNSFTSTACVVVPGSRIQYGTTTTTTTQAFSGGSPISAPVTVVSPLPPALPTFTDLDGVCYTPGTPTVPAVPPITGIGAPGKPGSTWSNGLGGPVVTIPPTVPTSFVPPTTVVSCANWPCIVNDNTASGGSVNSLADVAQYYYVTDLRPEPLWAPSIGRNGVPTSGAQPKHEVNSVTWQHMSTYVVGLGVSGLLNYSSNYRDIPPGADLSVLMPKAPPALSPNAAFAGLRDYDSPQAWPIPASDQPASIDDFWHTAVNGRGKYVSAGNPDEVATAIREMLAEIGGTVGTGAGSAAAASSTSVASALTDAVYTVAFNSAAWSGDLRLEEAFLRPPADKPVAFWSASAKLNTALGAGCDNRNIFILRNGAPNNLATFTWNTFRCAAAVPTGAAQDGLNAAERALITAGVPTFAQYAQMTDGSGGTVNQRALASGANLINFLRGQRNLESTSPTVFTPNSASVLFRKRDSALGDISSSAPFYLKDTVNQFIDPGFAAYAATTSSRPGMIYVGSNGGMLHAFYAGESTTDVNGGREAWAYVPSVVFPELHRLGDTNYPNAHRFYVDGTPQPFDVYDAATSTWKTVLLGGLGAGGRGYYAIDVTDPVNPKGLWEFNAGPTCHTPASVVGATSDCFVGYTFGRPVAAKLEDGTWNVFVTSGYNNVNSPSNAGDGLGYLWVLDAITGRVKFRMQTTAGSAGNPSGLNQIAIFADDPTVNPVARQVYGVDLKGNVWRFDVNNKGGLGAAGRDVVLLGQAKDPSGNPQPISTTPMLTSPNLKPVVVVGTGLYVGASDVTSRQQQSVYGIVDPLNDVTPTVYTDLRTALVGRALTATATGATSSPCALVDCTGSTRGWFVDLPPPAAGVASERVRIDPLLARGTVFVATSQPTDAVCAATSGGGTGAFYQFNVRTGDLMSNGRTDSDIVGTAIDQGSSAGNGGGGGPGGGGATPTCPSGQLRVRITEATGATRFVCVEAIPVDPKAKRTSWREVVQQ
jgi:type IV pilus assembly protein PilY1